MIYAILICDDEISLAEELADYFRLRGWRVSVASSFDEASQCLVNEARFDCLLTDWAMPETTGDTLVAFAIALPAHKVPLLIAIMSGIELADGFTHGELAGFTLQKPFDPKLVEERIMAVVTSAPASVGVST